MTGKTANDPRATVTTDSEPHETTRAARPKFRKNEAGGPEIVTISANENKAGKNSQQAVGTGWGRVAKVADVTADRNEGAEDSQQAVATANTARFASDQEEEM